jgi:hypothetical protein
VSEISSKCAQIELASDILSRRKLVFILEEKRRLKMKDRGRDFSTEKKSSSGSNRDLTRKHYEERSESQPRDEKRHSATSSQGRERLALASGKARDRQARQKQQFGDEKRKSAINSDKGEYRAKSSSTTEKISTRSQNYSMHEIQRRIDQLTLGTKKGRSRATSSLGWGTQGRRLRGGMEKGESSNQQGESNKGFNHSETGPFQPYKREETSKQQEDDQDVQKFYELLSNIRQLREISNKQAQPWKPEFKPEDFQ